MSQKQFSKVLFIFFLLVCFFLPLTHLLSFPRKIITVTLPDGRKIEATVADSAELRAVGLMGRSHLDSKEGMIFIFETSEPHMMWMKQMLISLDMVWLNEKNEIIEIIPSIVPCRKDPCPVYGPSSPSKYVLEIPDGTSSTFHLRKGMKLKFP